MSLIEEWVLLAQINQIIQKKRPMSEKIIPALWFDQQANEAFDFYSDILPQSKIITQSTSVVEAELFDQKFIGINGGPLFQPNPSISFTILLEEKALIQEIWNELEKGGKALMPLQRYEFSELYGWVEDRYGFSWQLFYADSSDYGDQRILPSLMFCGSQQGQCDQALKFYQALFPDFRSDMLVPYPDGESTGQVMYSQFALRGTTLTAMDSGIAQNFSFNEAVSLTIPCHDQQEIDYFWDRLTADGQEGNCGWCKDPFGVSWQVVPKELSELLRDPRAMERFKRMKKIDLQELQEVVK